jgi:tRNA(Ile)-lysidine synthase
MNSSFLDFIQKYKTEPVALAVSGGVDSIALMHWYAQVGAPAVVLHVNHHLRPESKVESEYVAATATALGLRCVILDWAGDKPIAGLEAAARKARYALMLDWCLKNNVEVLMTAHQADDQIETFLMNLGRGSGVYGLGGIRAESERNGIVIARPLLRVFRRELQDWCDSHNVKYFKDAMNDDENFTRVKIRKNRHLLRDNLGISDERILLAIDNLSRAREALESETNVLLNSLQCAPPERGGSGRSPVGGADNFDIRQPPPVAADTATAPPLGGGTRFPASRLFSMPAELRLKFLGQTLKKVSGSEYSPRLRDIIRLLEKLSGDTIATLSGCSIRRLGDRILITKEGESISFREKEKKRKPL